MIHFDYDLDPDANGVFDGREIARHLIATAYRLVAPYTEGCPRCTDKLVSAIANAAIEELWQDITDDGRIKGAIMTAGDAPESTLLQHFATADR